MHTIQYTGLIHNTQKLQKEIQYLLNSSQCIIYYMYSVLFPFTNTFMLDLYWKICPPLNFT